MGLGDMRDGQLYWSTDIATFMLVVRGGKCVDCPSFAEKWALGRQVIELIDRATRHGAKLFWEGPMIFEEEE